MKRREKRREKKRNVNELKSQPSAKQSNTRRLLGAVHSLATYWKFRQVAPVQQFAAYRMHHPRHPFVTPLQPPRHDRSWSKIYFGREKRKKTERVFQEDKEEEEEEERERPRGSPVHASERLIYPECTSFSRSDSTRSIHTTRDLEPRGGRVKRAPTVRVHVGSRHCQSRSNHRDARFITRTISRQILRRNERRDAGYMRKMGATIFGQSFERMPRRNVKERVIRIGVGTFLCKTSGSAINRRRRRRRI